MTTLPIRTDKKIIYPDSDGQPMADNTQQFRWIVLIKENLELIFADATTLIKPFIKILYNHVVLDLTTI